MCAQPNHAPRASAVQPDKGAIVLRNWRSNSDTVLVSDIARRSYRADGIDVDLSPERLGNMFEHMAGMDPREDVFIAEVDGVPAGYLAVFWRDEQGGPRVYRLDPVVTPEFRDSDVLQALYRASVQRVSEISGAHPADREQVLALHAADSETELLELAAEEGFQPVRYFYRMVRPDLDDVPLAPMPEGLEVRPVEESHMRAIFEAHLEAFRDHWGVREPAEEDYDLWINDPDSQPDLWQVAWEGDQVAGSVLNFIDQEENRRYDRLRGYTEDISVRRPWRRRGLATALIARSLRHLRSVGMEEAALGVDADNPNGALGLYTSLGYQLDWASEALRKPLPTSRGTGD